MRTQWFVNRRLVHVLFHDLPQALSAQTLGGTVNEEMQSWSRLHEFGAPVQDIIVELHRGEWPAERIVNLRGRTGWTWRR